MVINLLRGLLTLAVCVGLMGVLAPPTQAQESPATQAQGELEADGGNVAAEAAAEDVTDAEPEASAALPTVIDEETASQITRWSGLLDLIAESLATDTLTLDELAGLRDQTVTVRDGAQVLIDELGPRLADQQALLEGLVPSDDGELIETPEILAQQARVLALETVLQPAELLLGRANTLREQIVTRRAEEFTRALFGRTTSLLSPNLWVDGISGLPAIAQRFRILATTSWNAVADNATPMSLLGLGLLVLVLVLAAVPLRRFALRKAARSGAREPSAFEKTLGALRIVAVSTLIPAAAFLLVLFSLETIGGLSGRAESLVGSFTANILLFFVISGALRAFLAPDLPAWRLVPVADDNAKRASTFFRLAAFAYLVGEIMRDLASVFVSPLVVVQLIEALPTLVAALALLVGLRAVLQGLIAPDPGQHVSVVHLLWRWTLPVAAFAALAVLVAQLFGYLALAAFIVDRIVWTAVVLAALHLLATFIEGASSATFQDDARTAAWLHDNIGLSRNGLGQFGVLLAGLAKLVLIIAAASFIIAPFGVETDQLTTVLRRVFTGIEIGGFTFSLTSVLIALGLVVLGVIITRAVQGWLENRYLPRTSLDTGLKASIRTGIGYIGVIVAAMVGLSYLGLNLENVALVAGALSVGIGFGLQSIVSNFVSGLILLAERPFKQGDWVVVGDEQGIVKRINVRATEIQTFDRATVLIPNQDFIAGTVKNRVHRDTLGRIDVPVGVGYDSDPEEVKAILLEIANAHPQTLSYPEPAAFFVEFGANSLDFMLFAYLADVGNGYGVRSDIRFEIFKRFKAAGIEIPFAQSDVTIRNLDQVLEVMAKAGLAVPEGVGAGSVDPDHGQKQTGVSTVPSPTTSTPAELASGRRIDPDGEGDTGQDDASSNDGPASS